MNSAMAEHPIAVPGPKADAAEKWARGMNLAVCLLAVIFMAVAYIWPFVFPTALRRNYFTISLLPMVLSNACMGIFLLIRKRRSSRQSRPNTTQILTPR
jgi:hypothetical protein